MVFLRPESSTIKPVTARGGRQDWPPGASVFRPRCVARVGLEDRGGRLMALLARRRGRVGASRRQALRP